MMAITFWTDPTDGMVWWYGDNVRSFIWNQALGVWTRPHGTALPKNYFLNPAMQINEQNGLTDGSNVQGLIMAEGYFMQHAFSGGGVYRGQRVASPTPGGSPYRLRVTCTTKNTTLGASDWLVFSTPFEGSKMIGLRFGTTAAKWCVARWGWKSPAGWYCFGIKNALNTEAYSYPFRVRPAKHNIEHVQYAIIPRCMWDTWQVNNTLWGTAYWSLINGNMTDDSYVWTDSNKVASWEMDNVFMDTVGNVAELFDVGFYMDPDLTGISPDWQMPNYEDDYAECSRYWHKMQNARGIAQTATTARVSALHPVPMARSPTLSVVGTPKAYDGTTVAAITAAAHTFGSTTEFYGTLTTSGQVAGRPCGLIYDAAASYIAMDARI
jgi:hypothetical protein